MIEFLQNASIILAVLCIIFPLLYICIKRYIEGILNLTIRDFIIFALSGAWLGIAIGAYIVAGTL